MNDHETHTSELEEQEMDATAFAGLRPLEDGDIISESELAAMLGKHPTSIKRAVERGEFPPSVRLMGKPIWTAGAIRAHIGERLEEEKRKQQELERKVTRLKP